MESATTEQSESAPWEQLHALIAASDAEGLDVFIRDLPPWEKARAVSRLSESDSNAMLTLLPQARAAELMEIVNITQAVEMLETLEPNQAAAIVDGMRSDHQADVLHQLPNDQAEAILESMSPAQASDARRLAEYDDDTAGGIMTTEYLAFPRHLSAATVLDIFRDQAATYSDYPVQYLYVIDGEGRLVGVVPLRALLFAAPEAKLDDVMIREPKRVQADMPVDELAQVFEELRYLAVPVTDADGHLVGIARRAAVESAAAAKANQMLLKISGIIGGEEFRTMPLYIRSGRRLTWLSLNIVLNMISASIIAMYQDTLAAAITLAVFLPMISDMSGCSGNQAVAVSMRELTLGLLRPNEILRVIFKEAMVGLVNGVVLGALLAAVAYMWKGNPYLGLVVGAALACNTLIAVCWGGMLPLIIKKLRFDPALVAGPLLTTVTDMCNFFLVFNFASMCLDKIATK